MTDSEGESKKRNIREELEPFLVRVPFEGEQHNAPEKIHIDKSHFTIGRNRNNNISILSVLISRTHCSLDQDEADGKWMIKNLSSTDTYLNGIRMLPSESKVIAEGDILQLSQHQYFCYKFTFQTVDIDRAAKHLKLNDSNIMQNGLEFNNVLCRQKSFVQFQENERKDLEKQLVDKQQEQEELKTELEKLLKEQTVTKSCNEELNNQIAELKNKIESGNKSEIELQDKYRELLQKLEEERVKFEEKLKLEKAKWQEALIATKEEKEKLQMSIEEWRVKQKEEWDNKIENMLQEEKNVQTKLESEKLLLEQRLQEMENTLKEREAKAKEEEEKRKAEAEAAEQLKLKPGDNCVIVDSQGNTIEVPILDTIDLTQIDGESSKNQFVNKVSSIMDEQLTCSICSELYITAMNTNCTHTFCRDCIESWMKRKKICPECRAPITSLTRSLVVDNFIEKMLESLTPEQMAKRKELVEERKKAYETSKKKSAPQRSQQNVPAQPQVLNMQNIPQTSGVQVGQHNFLPQVVHIRGGVPVTVRLATPDMLQTLRPVVRPMVPNMQRLVPINPVRNPAPSNYVNQSNSRSRNHNHHRRR